MALNILSQDPEETLSQALSWETCSQSSWSLACESRQGSSKHRDSNLKNSDASRIFHVPSLRHNNRREVLHHKPEPELEGTGFLPSSRYLQGRPPLREDGNPKGKHPRKPLPSWRLNKLKRISNRESVAGDYRELIWHEQREQERQERKLARGETPDNHQRNHRFRGSRPSTANLKKKKAKMTRRRENERKRVNRSIRDGDNPESRQPIIRSHPLLRQSRGIAKYKRERPGWRATSNLIISRSSMPWPNKRGTQSTPGVVIIVRSVFVI